MQLNNKMKFVGLLSGGKDSLFAVSKAISMGHQLVCAANLYSHQEADSFMFQTVATDFLPAVAECLDTPLIHRKLRGQSTCKTLTYTLTERDEVEDLYELLLEAKYMFPELQAVVSGAVFSDYQRLRVENVCSRLGLSSISPLWRKDQKELLEEMRSSGFESVLVKISSMGLQEKHLGQTVSSLIDYFDSLHKKFGFNIAGEGGEYETLILDAPIFKKRISIDESDKVVTGNSAYSPYGHLLIKKLSLVDKETSVKTDYKASPPVQPKLFRRHGELFSGEITSKALGLNASNFDHEVFVVLKGVKDMLEDQGLDLTSVYYLTAYLKSMTDFQRFNSVYSKFFSFANPPSRVCIELASQDCGVKVAFKATQSKKKCTHVQSISSWAPASIGPYSQSYLINNSLHLAGSIPLVPESMTLSEDSVNQCVANCAAVAKINDFSLDTCETCIVYYTGARPAVNENFFPFYVEVSNLPRAAPVELEMHLHKFLPKVEKKVTEVSSDSWTGRIHQSQCSELVNLTWFVEMENVVDVRGFLQDVEGRLKDYLDAVQHKSAVTQAQLMGAEDFTPRFLDYVNEVRVFDSEPGRFMVENSWVKEVPSVFLHSKTSAVLVRLQDFLQINTFQFINSGN